MTYGYPPAPPPVPPFQAAATEAGPPPRALRPVVGLLLANLGLSIILTVVVLIDRHSIVDYQLDHRHYADAEARRIARDALTTGLWSRVAGNVIVSVVYVFLVRALLRGRRWAYRRVLYIGTIGIVALVIGQFTTPYPLWMHVEALLQVLVLGGLLWCVTRPPVRSHFAKGLPGRDVRRFRKA